ncbi:putative bromodomain-containing protein [Cucumis melo var. makuwa]|uniref:Putative bromodomain-containing protein n=1 Tax=Cucumis melo var. makuwa TaxID=1194695 RepID=A0A5D3C1E4_CUCMM|nr:putative bromodomain-containing protein [Cucumis melo var. makuwa]
MYCIRKASPDRFYCAALLRNCYADTILKAREKALEKSLTDLATGDKRDPEKVRMEREELERQQREGWQRATDGAEVAATATDGNDDGTDGGELRTATNVSLFSKPFLFLGKGFPNALLTASGKPRPFPTHTYDVGKPRPWEYPYFPREAFPDALLTASGIHLISRRLVSDT